MNRPNFDDLPTDCSGEALLAKAGELDAADKHPKGCACQACLWPELEPSVGPMMMPDADQSELDKLRAENERLRRPRFFARAVELRCRNCDQTHRHHIKDQDGAWPLCQEADKC